MSFRFTISDLATFLGKSPVTIRGWDRKGFVSLPRVGTNRALTTSEVVDVAETAYRANRITTERYHLIRDAIFCLRLIEQENQ